jgi:signal transduction histidine kinase
VGLDLTPGQTVGARRAGGGGRATAARLAWATATIAASSGVLFLVLLAVNSRSPDVVVYEYWGAQAVTAIVFPVVGAIIVSRHPRNALGWLFCLMGLSSGLSGVALEYAAYAFAAEPEPPGAATAAWLNAWVGTPGFVSVALAPLLFPDGRPSRRLRPVVWIAAGAIVVGTVSFALIPGPLEGYPSVDNPFGIEGTGGFFEFMLAAVGLFLVATLFAGLASLIVRYRRSRGAERQQIKWFTYAAAVTPLALVGNSLFPDLSWLIGGVGVACIPVAIGVAILRYRLYDIDIVINRTLVYGTLTACVVGVYVLVIGYLGALFQTGSNLAVSLVATGIVAVLFAPLRHRLQRAVNRLMYGERDEPYAVLSRLGQRLEATLEPGAALPAVVETVAQALRLPYAAMELREDGEREGFSVVASCGSPVEPLAILPLVHQHETVGRLLLAPRAGEKGFSATDRRLLEDLARQAGAAAHAVRLTNDLQRARERLVAAREEERRRLRRDLHDGLGPQLSSQTLTIDAARGIMRHDPDSAEALLLDLKAQSRDAVADIRRLVYALRPPALDDLGLVGAMRASAAQYASNGLRVSVEEPEKLPLLPAAVEVAAYRIAQEALANVARHAEAGRCVVRLALDEEAGALRLEVADDGRGIGEDKGSGVGLHSMRERAAELGGSVTFGSPAGGGAVVLARLPLTEEGR